MCCSCRGVIVRLWRLTNMGGAHVVFRVSAAYARAFAVSAVGLGCGTGVYCRYADPLLGGSGAGAALLAVVDSSWKPRFFISSGAMRFL